MSGQSHRSCKDFEDQSVIEFKGRVDFTKAFSPVSSLAATRELTYMASKIKKTSPYIRVNVCVLPASDYNTKCKCECRRR
jgi:hypothetical protein